MTALRNAKRYLLDSGSCWLVRAACVVLLGGAANAQVAEPKSDASASAIDEIVVTATKRSVSVQKIPRAITALSEDFLKESGAQQVSDIVKAVPGLSWTQNSTGTVTLAIRGIQTGSIYSASQSPVAVYYDEVSLLDPYSSSHLSQINMFDISRVEVLKGPQGSLFGAGALSGVIRVITKKPDYSGFDAAAEMSVETTKGGDTGYLTNLMLNVPVVEDRLAIRAVGYYDSYGGYIDNSITGLEDVNGVRAYGGRVAIGWAPTDNLNFIATVVNEKTEPEELNYETYQGDDYVSNNVVRQFNDGDMDLYSLTATLTMPWATLTSSTSYLQRSSHLQRDFSVIANAITGLTTPSPLVNEFDSNNFNQELRLASTEDHRFQWLIGMFFEDYDVRLPELISQPGVAGLGYPTDYLEAAIFGSEISDKAVFGEVSYDLTPDLTLTAGIRYGRYSVGTSASHAIYGTTLFEGPPSMSSRSAEYSKATPDFSLSYTVAPDVMLYGVIAEGYRSGHANLVPDTDPLSGESLPVLYEPDELWNYELGIKSAFFDNAFVFNASIYYIDWTGIQLQQQSASYFYVDNAGDATSKGVEVEFAAKPVPPLEIGASLSYTDAELQSVLPGTQATPGDQLPGSSEWNIYLYGQYIHDLSGQSSLTFRTNYSYIDKVYSSLQNFGNPNALTYGSYGNLDAQVTLSNGRYEAQLYVRNLTDSDERVAALLLFPPTLEILQRPRTVGLTFRAYF